MSSPVSVMTEGGAVEQAIAARTRPTDPRGVGSWYVHANRSLTVPLLCSLRWCGFQVEGAYQIEGGITQGQALDTGPQVDDVAFLGARRVEALKDAVVEMHAEGAAASVAPVERASATALATAAAPA